MSWQAPAFFAAIVLAAASAGCSAPPQAGGDNGGAGGASSGSGGAVTSDGTGGAQVSSGGSGSGGAPTSNNGVDDGKLFKDAGTVTVPVDAAPPADGGAASDGTSANGGMAVLKMFPAQGISLAFTPNGADVTMVATHKGCGAMTVQIHGGYSCDNTSTQGGVWDGQRGDGISAPIVCNGQVGTMTYTRSGKDPTLSWTVGDHNAKTDVTYHPIFVDGNCLTFF